jgi:hypothetical protein
MPETPEKTDMFAESSMLIVAPEAALALRAALDGEWASDERAIRISFNTEGRMHMVPSDIVKDDKKVFFDNRIILVAAPEVAETLAGHTLSIRTSKEGSAFALRPTPDGEGAD